MRQSLGRMGEGKMKEKRADIAIGIARRIYELVHKVRAKLHSDQTKSPFTGKQFCDKSKRSVKV